MSWHCVFILFLALTFYSCANDGSDIKKPSQKKQELAPLDEIKDTKNRALDALDKIQLSGWHLYSTFANQQHDCKGEVSSFEINQDHFEDALLDLLNTSYPDIPQEERLELAATASKAQIDYVVKTCGATANTLFSEELAGPPRNGVWIFQSLLDQRDLIIKW